MTQELVPQTYKQVIYKEMNDGQTQDFLNSYQYEKGSDPKFKKWSPDITFEERYKKKREREDIYIKELEDKEKPILLVNEKHQYKGMQNPKIFKNPQTKEAYYKISENTHMVEDINQQIHDLKNFIRRNTKIHKLKNVNPEEENLSSFYKIEGKEFLPGGFIELDPLLMMDEYEFDAKVHKEMFSEYQRKMKALRRKQYEQRDQKKIRDVTIFILDEQKHGLIKFLKKWDNKNSRKLNFDEIEYASNILQVDPKRLSHLQDLYYKSKEILKNPSNPKLSSSLPKQYYSHAHKNASGEYLYDYSPHFVDRIDYSYTRSKSQNVKKNDHHPRKRNNTEFDKTLIKPLRKTELLNLPKKPTSQYKRLSKTSQLNENNSTFIKKQNAKRLSNLKKKSTKAKKSSMNNNLKNYFDQEMNRILGQIEGNKVKNSIHENLLRNSLEHSSLNSAQDQSEIGNETIEENEIILEDKKVIQKLKPILIQNEFFYQTVEEDLTDDNKRRITLTTKNNQGDIIKKESIPFTHDGSFYKNQVLHTKQLFPEDKSKRIVVRNDVGEIVSDQRIHPTNSLVNKNLEKSLNESNFKKASIKKNSHVKTFLLKPLKVKTKVYQTIVQEIKNQNGLTVQILVQDNKNNQLYKKDIPQTQRSKNYIAYVDKDSKDMYNVLNVQNCEGDKLAAFELKKDLMRERGKSLVYYVHNQDKQFTVYRLNPIVVDENILVQKIEVDFDKKSNLKTVLNNYSNLQNDEIIYSNNFSKYSTEFKPKLGLLITLNEKGENIAEFKLPSSLLQQQMESFDKIVDANQRQSKRKSSISIKRVNAKKFRTTVLKPILFQNMFYHQIINEILDHKNPENSKGKIITIDEQGNELGKYSLNNLKLAQTYYNKHEIFNDDGETMLKLQTYNDRDELILEEIIKQDKNQTAVMQQKEETGILNEIQKDESEIEKDKKSFVKKKKQKFSQISKTSDKNDEGINHQRKSEFKMPKYKKSNVTKKFQSLNQNNANIFKKESLQEDQESFQDKIEQINKKQKIPTNYFPKFNSIKKFENTNQEKSVKSQINEESELNESKTISQNDMSMIRKSINKAYNKKNPKTSSKYYQSEIRNLLDEDDKNKEQDSIANISFQQQFSSKQAFNYDQIYEDLIKDKKAPEIFDSSQIDQIIKNENLSKKPKQQKQKKSSIKKAESKKQPSYNQVKKPKKKKKEKLEFKLFNSTELPKKELPKSFMKFQKEEIDVSRISEQKTPDQIPQFKLTKTTQQEIDTSIVSEQKNPDQIPQFKSAKNSQQEIESQQSEDNNQKQSQKNTSNQQQQQPTKNSINQSQEQQKQSSKKLFIKQPIDISEQQLSSKNESLNQKENLTIEPEKEKEFKQKIFKIFEQEKSNIKPELFEQIRQNTELDSLDDLLSDFYKFCIKLYRDSKYKNSILFATVFYYYLDFKNAQMSKQMNLNNTQQFIYNLNFNIDQFI